MENYIDRGWPGGSPKASFKLLVILLFITILFLFGLKNQRDSRENYNTEYIQSYGAD